MHIINGLGQGGAESMLFKVLVATKERTCHVVISLQGDGAYGDRIRDLGVAVHSLHVSGVFRAILNVVRLYAHIKEHRPEIIQTWMYHADLIGGIAARLAGVRTVV